jgi:hypothetical protein
MFPLPVHLGPAAAAAASSGPSGAFLDTDSADVTDGAGVAATMSGNGIGISAGTMSGSASSGPSTLQKAWFWDSSTTVANLLALFADMNCTSGLEESSAVTASLIILVGHVAVPDGASPSLANLATHKSRWVGIKINGPNVNIDVNRNNTNFTWGSNNAMDVTEPTDYRWKAFSSPLVYTELSGQAKFTYLTGIDNYPNTTGAGTSEASDVLNTDDDLNNDDTIYTFLAVGRAATGGSTRAVTVEASTAVVARPS